MTRATIWAPIVAALFGVLWFGGMMRSASDPAGEMQIRKFGKLPILENGRIKPFDTFARVQLMLVNRRQEYYEYTDAKREKYKKHPAMRLMLDLMAEGYAQLYPRIPFAFAINDPAVRKFLALPENPGNKFEMQQIMANQKAADKLAAILKKQQANQKLDPMEEKVLAALDPLRDRHREARDMEKKREEIGDTLNLEIYRIDSDQVRNMLDLEPREGLRYSFADLIGRTPKDQERKRDGRERMREFLQKAFAASKLPEKQRNLVDVKTLELHRNLTTIDEVRSLKAPLMVPPMGGGLTGWENLHDALMAGATATNPNAAALESIIRAYANNDVKKFNSEVDAYASSLQTQMPKEVSKARLEAWFHNFAPFYHCVLLYVVVLLLAIGSWVVWHEPLRRAAFSLAVVVLAVHTFALGVRIYLTGRPPVTNLYSSAVFIGWGCVLLCLIVEWVMWRNRAVHSIALVVAAALGFATMIVAHHLGSGDKDTMEVMQAVLDTNFWLATHVTTVTLGYTATFVAGFIASVYVFCMLASTVRSYFLKHDKLMGWDVFYFLVAVFGVVMIPAALLMGLMAGLWLLLSDGDVLILIGQCLLVIAGAAVLGFIILARRFSTAFQEAPKDEVPPIARFATTFALTPVSGKVLANMVYGVVCFAVLLSFVGTVLGGIWADQSWGRFWGWDPKENGALLIVIMNALILHARWSGMVKERGMCALAIAGNMVTAWSWFGTNQLGVGLHAYGFNNTLATGCAVFWISQMGLIGLSLLPLRFWRTYADPALAMTPASVPPGPRLQGGRKGTGIQPA